MKKQIKHLRNILPLFILLIAFSGITQGSITHIALRENRSGNGDCTMLDIPQILGNPSALLFISQKDQSLNPHPIGAYYFKNRWNIMNLDQAGMPDYAKFNVEYFINPDNDHFQYVIKREDIRKDGTAFINHPALNDHPDSKFSIFHTWVPESKEYGNREATSVQYYPSLNRWVLKNVNNKALTANVAYNIAVSSHGQAVSNPVTTTPVTTTPVNTTGVTTTPVNTNPTNTNPTNTSPTNTSPTSTNPTNTNPTNTNPTGPSSSGPVIVYYMTVWVKGVKLPGESMRTGFQDQVQLVDLLFTVNAPREKGSGMTTARRSYDPITITKLNGGPATIPYFNAFLKSEDLVITIDAYSHEISATSGSTGAEVLNYTIKLSTASFSGFQQVFQDLGSLRAKGFMDVLKISFNKIEFIKDGVSVIDTFQ